MSCYVMPQIAFVLISKLLTVLFLTHNKSRNKINLNNTLHNTKM